MREIMGGSLRRAMLGTAMLAVLGAPAYAQSIDTHPAWDGVFGVSSWGTGATQTYGQTITAVGNAPSRLSSFSFEVQQQSGVAQQYQAFVYRWDPNFPRIVGNALYTSSVMTTPVTGAAYVPISFNTGTGVTLMPGAQYALFVTVNSVGAQANGAYKFGTILGSPYSGGTFVAHTGNGFASLLNFSWVNPNVDLAFSATITPGVTVGQNNVEVQQGVAQLMNQYMNVLTDPFVANRGGAAAMGFASEPSSKLPPGVQSAFAKYNKAPAAQSLADPRYSIWGTAFGGTNKSSGTPALGVSDTATTVGGFAAGVDYMYSPNSMIGFSLAGGSTSWSVADNNGTGRSDALLVGIYGAHNFSTSYYLSGALSYGNYWAATNRVVAADQFDAKFNVQNFGGRLELGRHFDVAGVARVTPYAALQTQFFSTPSYTESASAGAGPFALAFASRDAWVVRSEIGSRVERTWQLNANNSLRVFGKLAYGHDEFSDRSVTVTLPGLAVPGFVVNSAASATDLALVAAGSEWKIGRGWSLMAKFDGEFSERTQTYSGSGRARYTW